MKKSSLFVLLLVFAAMFAANFIADRVMERWPRIDDEMTYLYQARLYQTGRLYMDSPSPSSPTRQPFIIDCAGRIEREFPEVDCQGKRFSKYAPGWPLMLAVGTWIGFPWVVNLWFAGISVAFIYRTGSTIYDETVGMVAAFLLTVSPLAILLSGTIMSHTFTHFLVLVFMFGLWNIQQNRHPRRWAIAAGIALGWLAMSRPLTAVGVSMPWVMYSSGRLLWTLFRDRYGIVQEKNGDLRVIVPAHPRPRFIQSLIPLLILAIFAVSVASFYLVNNYVLTGNPRASLYEYVAGWPFDKIGFGPDKGPTGHTPAEAWAKIKESTGCYSRDLYGWVLQPDNPPDRLIPLRDMCVTDRTGISWIVIPLGLLFLPHRRLWSAMLILTAISVMLTSGLYWGVGPGYGSRYWFEFTGGLILVSSVGIVGLSRWMGRYRLKPAVYVLLSAATIFVMVDFMPARLEPIHDYPCEKYHYQDTINELRESPDRPVVVIAYGDEGTCRGRSITWWDYGELLTWTDPAQTADIIVVRDHDKEYLDQLLAQYQDEREVMFLIDNQIYRYADVIEDIRAEN